MVNRRCLEANMQFQLEDKASQDGQVNSVQVKSGQVKTGQVKLGLGNARKFKSGQVFGTRQLRTEQVGTV